MYNVLRNLMLKDENLLLRFFIEIIYKGISEFHFEQRKIT